jgi:hypothetical protein
MFFKKPDDRGLFLKQTTVTHWDNPAYCRIGVKRFNDLLVRKNAGDIGGELPGVDSRDCGAKDAFRDQKYGSIIHPRKWPGSLLFPAAEYAIHQISHHASMTPREGLKL